MLRVDIRTVPPNGHRPEEAAEVWVDVHGTIHVDVIDMNDPQIEAVTAGLALAKHFGVVA